MLPLTRNIFRQTATSFNNTTERWKQESYYIQIQMVKCRCLWLPGENLHRSIEKSDDAESNNHGVSRVTSLNGDVVQCDLVNTDSPTCTRPMMLCFRAAKRGDFFFLFVSLLLFHFKAFSLSHRGDRVCGQKMRVFKGERCARRVDSWGCLLVFILGWRRVTWRPVIIWLMGNGFHPSYIPVSLFRAAWFVQNRKKNNQRRKQQF